MQAADIHPEAAILLAEVGAHPLELLPEPLRAPPLEPLPEAGVLLPVRPPAAVTPALRAAVDPEAGVLLPVRPLAVVTPALRAAVDLEAGVLLPARPPEAVTLAAVTLAAVTPAAVTPAAVTPAAVTPEGMGRPVLLQGLLVAATPVATVRPAPLPAVVTALRVHLPAAATRVATVRPAARLVPAGAPLPAVKLLRPARSVAASCHPVVTAPADLAVGSYHRAACTVGLVVRPAWAGQAHPGPRPTRSGSAGTRCSRTSSVSASRSASP